MSKSKVVSVSLFGREKKYLDGAIRLADSVGKNLPGWALVFFVGMSVPEETIRELAKRKAEIVRVDEKEDLSATSWRFRLHQLGNAEWVLFRDSDSIVSRREAHAVGQWVESGTYVHIIRDHPFHNSKMLAGLWGLRPGFAPWFQEAVESYTFTSDYGSDQDFLASMVYPRIQDSCMLHTSFHGHEGPERTTKFQVGSDRLGEFCGESITASFVVRAYARLRRLIDPRVCKCI